MSPKHCVIFTPSIKSVRLWAVKIILLGWFAARLELPRDTDHRHRAAAIPHFTRF